MLAISRLGRVTETRGRSTPDPGGLVEGPGPCRFQRGIGANRSGSVSSVPAEAPTGRLRGKGRRRTGLHLPKHGPPRDRQGHGGGRRRGRRGPPPLGECPPDALQVGLLGQGHGWRRARRHGGCVGSSSPGSTCSGGAMLQSAVTKDLARPSGPLFILRASSLSCRRLRRAS